MQGMSEVLFSKRKTRHNQDLLDGMPTKEQEAKRQKKGWGEKKIIWAESVLCSVQNNKGYNYRSYSPNLKGRHKQPRESTDTVPQLQLQEERQNYEGLFNRCSGCDKQIPLTYKKVEIDQPEDKGILLKDILETGLPYLEKSQALTATYYKAQFNNSLARHQRTMVAEPIINLLDSVLYNKYNQRTLKYKSATQTYKCYGNSFTVPVIKHILEYIFLGKKVLNNKIQRSFFD
jgi:site-specific DNA-cytosine methylase